MKKTASLLTLLIMCLGAAFAQNEPMHGWHTYCASEFNEAISYGTHTTVATCYPPDMASNFAGTQITKVAMFSDGPNNSIGGIYTCSIYLGGETPSEGLIAYTMSCDVPQGLNDWAEFDLSTPIWVTGDETIWIVWQAEQPLSPWHMGVCSDIDPSGNGIWAWNGTQWDQIWFSTGDWMVKTYFNWDEPQLQDVYVSGNHFTTGKVLKNNTLLYSITDSIDIQLKGIQVAEDGTIYGAGYAYNSSDNCGRVWMNDSCIFTATNTYFDHIALNGDNWTVAGGNNVWQNGELLYSYIHEDDECHIHSLAVDTMTGDIYTGGAIYLSGEYLAYASVWKNDSLLWMEDTVSSVENICFDGGNLYAAGFKVANDSLSYGVIWQNDSIIYQMENANFVNIAAFDGSLYWTGISLTDTTVCIWQDGEVLYALPELSGISNLVVNESGVYYTDAQTVYKDGEVLYQPEEFIIITDLIVKPAPPVPTFTLTVESDNPDWGTVIGGGEYHYGDTATIEAIPNVGHEFLMWNDSVTDNPRNVVVTQDSTFIASFGICQFTITVKADQPSWGTVTGGGTYYYGDTIQISATANLGFAFIKWHDGNTNNPREIIVTGDATYTALFDIRQCEIRAEVSPAGAGTIDGGGVYNYGETIRLTVHNNQGFVFDRWDDGNITNPRIVLVEGDATYTALFNAVQYEITTEADPEEGGTVRGAGIYDYGATASLKADPNEGYMFISWHDGIMTNPRNVTVTQNAHYKALFYLIGTPEYTITVLPNDPELGTVTGSGTYPENTSIEISAVPVSGAIFEGWHDGNTDNPRTVVVTADTTYKAIFSRVETYTITVKPESPFTGSTYGSGTYPAGTAVNIGAIPSNGFYFSGWHDGNADNPRSIVVTQNAEYVAYFSQEPVPTYTVTVYCDENQGFVLGAGTYTAGATATLAAIPADGYMFVKWSDGVTENSRDIVVNQDIVLAAFFDQTGLNDSYLAKISLFPNPANDQIRIEGLDGENEIQIFSTTGRLVKTAKLSNNEALNVSDLNAGVYLVRINETYDLKFIKE